MLFAALMMELSSPLRINGKSGYCCSTCSIFPTNLSIVSKGDSPSFTLDCCLDNYLDLLIDLLSLPLSNRLNLLLQFDMVFRVFSLSRA